MSNPQNRLADFQSYSAMHILIMCESIKTANLLQVDPSVFVDNTDDPEQLFDIHTIDGTIDPGYRGQYIVVFDGRKNANYSIESVKWKTNFAPIGDNYKAYNQIELDGELVVEEPFGLEFLETLTKGASAMGVAPSRVVYMLKTFFVGFDGNGNQQIIDDIQPFAFVVLGLQAEMEAKGSTYKLNIMGVANGVSKLPQVADVAGGLKVVLNKGEPLFTAIGSLQANINDAYKRYKTLMIKTLQEEINAGLESTDQEERLAANENPSASSIVDELYSDVKYKIKLDPKYTLAYVVGGNESDVVFSDDGTAVINFEPDATVEDCIGVILKTCIQIEKESAVQKNETVSFLPKISTLLIPSDYDDTYIIEYTVNRMMIQHQEVGKVFDAAPGEYIEFDYIYTGKNTDILEMDMKMKWGLNFLNTRINHAPVPATNEDEEYSSIATSTPTSLGTPHHADPAIGTDKLPTPVKSPLYMGTTVMPNSFVSKRNMAGAMTFDEALARQASLENLQAEIKIVGNPQLLNESLSTSEDLSSPADFNTSLSNMYTRPGLVKINIKFPSNKELTGVKDFWYKGWFRILELENEFSGGVFTQTLGLIALQVVSSVPKTLAETDSKQYPNPGAKIKKYTVNRSDVESDANQSTRDYKFGRLRADDNGNGDSRRDPEVELFAKRGALLAGLTPTITNIYDEIIETWAKYTKDGVGVYKNVIPVITSGNDSTHKVGSLHGTWQAIDLRANNLAEDRAESIEIGMQIARELSIRIGNDYDVIYENFVNDYGNNHIHVEYDPKFTSVLNDDGDTE